MFDTRVNYHIWPSHRYSIRNHSQIHSRNLFECLSIRLIKLSMSCHLTLLHSNCSTVLQFKRSTSHLRKDLLAIYRQEIMYEMYYLSIMKRV